MGSHDERRETKQQQMLNSSWRWKAIKYWIPGLLFACGSVWSASAQNAPRPVTVSDVIEMTRLGDPVYLQGGPSKGRVASFSPDGKRFIVPIVKGNLKNNTNEYSLLLFETARIFEDRKPVTLLTLASSSNRAAIGNIRWLNDRSIAFVGESRGELPQVYRFDVQTKSLERLTQHATSVAAFDIASDGKTILYAADRALRQLGSTEGARRNGIVVDTAMFLGLLGTGGSGYDPTATEGQELYLKIGSGAPTPVSMEDRLFAEGALSFAPGGRYAMIATYARQVPKAWSLYAERRLHELVTAEQSGDTSNTLRRYSLLDVDARTVTPLFDAPSDGRKSAFFWTTDGLSLIMSGTYLPLDALDETENQRRKTTSYVVEVKLPSRSYTIISEKDLKLTEWNADLQRILLENPYPWKLQAPAAYERGPQGWHETNVQVRNPKNPDRIDVTLEESLNLPPRLAAHDPKSGRTGLLLDLNPQFASLQFGHEEILQWTSTDGHAMKGGLYFPVGFVPGNRYPLVIQTHGFLPDRFWPDGPWSSAFAAQALAGKGIFVLQIGTADNVEEERGAVNTPREAPREMASYEGAIDELDRRGWVDPARVGIIGFSRTVYHVSYTLTHSKYHFRAATLADGMNGGYFQYILAAYFSPDSYLVNGGKPSRENLSLWFDRAPGFNTDRVETPVRIEGYGNFAYLSAWEWYRRLTEQKKPVELIFLPDGTHLLVKPWERLTSQEGNVDWYVFWLKGEENNDADKKPEFERWRGFRALMQHRNERNE
jgi:dipeptidyl aminopeptidase/acylaminoacyl peptidase